MKSRRERAKRVRMLHLWDLSEVHKASPYLRSVIGSLREHWLDTLNTQRKLDLAEKQPDARGRGRLIALQDLQEERHRTQKKFDDALEELNRLDVFLLDAVQGLALVPFRKADELAWYVFDHFTEKGLIGWRYHGDPIEECRPLSELQTPVANDSVSS